MALLSLLKNSTSQSHCKVPTILINVSLPDDSETCVDSFGKALENRGIELVKPNETCDVVYCYCGIRMHPLSCPEEFVVNSRGELVGGESLKRLERHCLSSNGYAGIAGCSKCVNSLYLVSA
ncbi:hypothetical protein RND71_006198 [Anisodus tanguticus]|uniref:SPARK domain-containing protein n=1 Tax=Anisodus tanguticus TaxID=243964 RepID=A0AAE1VT05_9SOLA|nr:hypothetical protein RND71_006198 [Anisodus tanguticus]